MLLRKKYVNCIHMFHTLRKINYSPYVLNLNMLYFKNSLSKIISISIFYRWYKRTKHTPPTKALTFLVI